MNWILVISLAFLASLVTSEQTWPHLRTTYKLLGGFKDQPRTADELSVQGWIPLSTCTDGNENFPGDRFARTQNDNDIVLIFDGNGFIAGIQTIVPLEKAMNDTYYPFSTSEWYVKGDFFGSEVYYATAYFVDPAIICNGGRDQQQFDLEGTGNGIWLQNGPTPSEVMNIPLFEADMANQSFWYKHKCFYHMGIHYFTFNYNPNQSCDEGTAFQIVYDLNGNLNGIVFQHTTSLESKRFEAVTTAAVNSIVTDPPTCLFDLVKEPGQSTMHVYVGDYLITC